MFTTATHTPHHPGQGDACPDLGGDTSLEHHKSWFRPEPVCGTAFFLRMGILDAVKKGKAADVSAAIAEGGDLNAVNPVSVGEP